MTDTDNPTIDEIRRNAQRALKALDAFDAIVEAYVAATPDTVARFGMESVGQPEFIYRLRKGADMRRSTMRKVLAHVAGEK